MSQIAYNYNYVNGDNLVYLANKYKTNYITIKSDISTV